MCVFIVHAGLGFFLKGRFLSNNSIVLFGDIGEGSSALYCLTDRTLCCSTGAGQRHGLWKFPSGADVSDRSTDIFYSVRGFSSIHLNRRSSAVGPTGVYTCLIPSSSDTSRKLLLGVYTADGGGGLHEQLLYIGSLAKLKKKKIIIEGRSGLLFFMTAKNASHIIGFQFHPLQQWGSCWIENMISFTNKYSTLHGHERLATQAVFLSGKAKRSNSGHGPCTNDKLKLGTHRLLFFINTCSNFGRQGYGCTELEVLLTSANKL